MILPRTQLFVLWIDNVVQWYVADHQTTPDLLRRCWLVLSSHAVSPSGLTTDSLVHPANGDRLELWMDFSVRPQCVFPMRFWDTPIVPKTCQWCNLLLLETKTKKNAWTNVAWAFSRLFVPFKHFVKVFSTNWAAYLPFSGANIYLQDEDQSTNPPFAKSQLTPPSKMPSIHLSTAQVSSRFH